MCVAGIGVSMMTSYRRMLAKPKAMIAVLCLGLGAGMVLLTPNPVSARFLQVATGSDSSTQSRTVFSFIAANAVATSKSVWWGAGMGQGKLVDFSDLGIGFTSSVIPNAVAGTYAEFGLIGVLVRLAVAFVLFSKTRVHRSSYRTAMFVVAFITQFTGSYLADVQEYVLWFLAFYPLFPDLEVRAASRRVFSQLPLQTNLITRF